jgi:hypothetical protein
VPRPDDGTPIGCARACTSLPSPSPHLVSFASSAGIACEGRLDSDTLPAATAAALPRSSTPAQAREPSVCRRTVDVPKRALAAPRGRPLEGGGRPVLSACSNQQCAARCGPSIGTAGLDLATARAGPGPAYAHRSVEVTRTARCAAMAHTRCLLPLRRPATPAPPPAPPAALAEGCHGGRRRGVCCLAR